MEATCPQCGHDDQVQNVEAVIRSGARYWNNTAVYMGESELSSQLHFNEKEIRSLANRLRPEDAESLLGHWADGCLFIVLWFFVCGPLLALIPDLLLPSLVQQIS